MIIVTAVVLYRRSVREQLAATAVLAVLWCALVLTLSRSSLGALLVGLATLGAVRWRATRVLGVALAVVAIGAAAIAASPKTFGLNQGVNGASSGRAEPRHRRHRPVRRPSRSGDTAPARSAPSTAAITRTSKTLSASHAIPVTIAAEQGVIGELTYIALLLRGRRSAPRRGALGPGPGDDRCRVPRARVPHAGCTRTSWRIRSTWTLLGVGAALARSPADDPKPSSGGAVATTAARRSRGRRHAHRPGSRTEPRPVPAAPAAARRRRRRRRRAPRAGRAPAPRAAADRAACRTAAGG